MDCDTCHKEFRGLQNPFPVILCPSDFILAIILNITRSTNGSILLNGNVNVIEQNEFKYNRNQQHLFTNFDRCGAYGSYLV